MTNMMFNNIKIKQQSEFCLELMERLHHEIDETNFLENDTLHTRKQADIVRLRRELNTLSKCLNPWE